MPAPAGAPGFDLDDGKVCLVVDGDDLGAHDAATLFQNRPPACAAGGLERQLDFDPGGVLHDVRVGDDVAVGVDDHAGAGGPFQVRLAGRSLVFLVGRRIPRDEDLHDARADLGGEILKRSRQLGQGRRPGRDGLSGRAGARQQTQEDHAPTSSLHIGADRSTRDVGVRS